MRLFNYLSVLAFCAIVPGVVGCSSSEVTPKKDVAIQLYSVRTILRDADNRDGKCDTIYTSILQKLADMGYTAVEAASYNNEKGTFYDRTAEDFKADVEATGMRVLSSHTGHALSPAELESGDLTPSLTWWDKCIADHKAAGMSYIVTPSMPVPHTLADLDTYCRYYNEIGKRCKEAGMTFGYHNHSYELENKIEGQTMYDYMIEHTDPDYVVFQMDVYWLVRGQNSPVDYFHKYPGRFQMLHIKDHREFGESGMVGFDAIFKDANMEAAGVKYIVAEIEQYSMPVEESVKASLDYLLNSSFVKASYAE